jgi:SAM-dependent methyltransferase
LTWEPATAGELDGLAALRQYNSAILAVQAEFDHLPFMDDEFDLAIFNASLHYASDYATTLGETLRVLTPAGRLAIIDSPLYHQADSGQAMVSERQERFKQLYGFPSNALPSQDFLTPAQLEKLSHDLDLSWQTIWPFFGLGWLLRPWPARLRGRREPASFPVLVGRRL